MFARHLRLEGEGARGHWGHWGVFNEIDDSVTERWEGEIGRGLCCGNGGRIRERACGRGRTEGRRRRWCECRTIGMRRRQ
ncbi:unnamed protein product [Chondrus crispus]|uniref:Uncharacterized protein n=1 Tax=Chondrus crispus TaxID=2769 RepID=R7QAU4_CHOCR|nr:unnamed protein product [Chondrus crispus]CDF34908.1 unnamed protein product [Chondrus crispus]|eukprot:XP_005714727.1 unnamed protein product [Chondrus crispus]